MPRGIIAILRGFFMPLYEHECEKCKSKRSVVTTIADRNKKVVCDCGHTMTRVISCRIERLEPLYLGDMTAMLPPQERKTVYDRITLNRAMDRSGLVLT